MKSTRGLLLLFAARSTKSKPLKPGNCTSAINTSSCDAKESLSLFLHPGFSKKLKDINQRLELLADRNPHVADAVMSICGTVRNAATIIEVLVATKLDGLRPQ
jgi:hypothetical protein